MQTEKEFNDGEFVYFIHKETATLVRGLYSKDKNIVIGTDFFYSLPEINPLECCSTHIKDLKQFLKDK